MTETKKKPAAPRKRPVKKFKFDSYVNNFTGIGSRDRDKAVRSSFERNLKLSETYLENLYHDNDVAGRICDLLPEEMMKRGFFIKTKDGETKDDISEYLSVNSKDLHDFDEEMLGVMMELDSLGAREKYIEAMIWSRVFGGSALYIGLDDGRAQEEPVNEANIQRVKFIKLLDSRDIQPWEYYEDPTEPKFGEPKTYKIQPVSASSFIPAATIPEAIVHESRVIPFQGTRTTPRRARENRGWSESILQKIDEVLAQFGQSWQATAHLMTDAAQGVFKMSGLVEAISSNTPEYVSLRLADTDMNRSIARMIAVDADNNEDFRRDSYSFNGIPQILELFMMRLSLAARIPVTILMGQSPAGMNATGESDIRWFYDTVKASQQFMLKPKLEYLIRLIMLSREGPTKGKEPELWSVLFPSPWQMNDFEQAEINKTRAETRKLLVEADRLADPTQAISPDQLEREKTAVSKEADNTPRTQVEKESLAIKKEGNATASKK